MTVQKRLVNLFYTILCSTVTPPFSYGNKMTKNLTGVSLINGPPEEMEALHVLPCVHMKHKVLLSETQLCLSRS